MNSITDSIRNNPGLYITEGILLIILGTIAIILPLTATIALGFVLGWVLLIGGIYRFFRSIKLKNELKHFWLSMLSGIVAAVVGILFLTSIITGIYLLTIALAAYFLIDGISLIVQAMTSHGYNNFGWILFSGIITLILGVLILSGLPTTAVWIPGLLAGINLIVTGFALTYSAASIKIPAQKMGI